MKATKFSGLLLIGVSLTTFLAFVGTTTGTLAWYAYSTRVSMSYMGTSVSKTEQLQIGIKDPSGSIDDSIIAANSYERDLNNIVWAPAGTGFTAAVISSYLKANGSPTTKIGEDLYANCLSPVTSKERALNSTNDLKLWQAPYAGIANNSGPAAIKDYISIPFAFRIIDNNNAYVGGKNIWITDAKSETTGGAEIHKSLRIFADDPSDTSNARRYLFNPSSQNSGSTIVAGLLDLDGDGFYDRRHDKAQNKYYEIVYGEGSYTGTVSYSTNPTTADSGLDDINNTGSTEETTFCAKHKIGTYTASYTGLTFGEAYYYGYSDMRPIINEANGHFINGKPIAVTDNTTKIGYSTLTIYLEGWDHSVIDQAIGYQFNLGITFEIDRV